MSIFLFEITLSRRDLDKWGGTRQEMEMIRICGPEEIPDVPSQATALEILCYNIDEATLEGLEDDILRQAPVRWERQIKLCIWSSSWSKVLRAWQSFALAQRFAVMIDGKKFANSEDLAAAANEIAVFGGCDFPYFEPSKNRLHQDSHPISSYDHIRPLLEWCQYHRTTLQNAAPALKKFRSTEELRALLPARFRSWSWSQVRMAQLLMPCGSYCELLDAVAGLFCPIVPSTSVGFTERYASQRSAWMDRNLRELDEQRRWDQLRRELERGISFEDDNRYLQIECA